MNKKSVWKYLDLKYPDLRSSSSQLRNELDYQLKIIPRNYQNERGVIQSYLIYHRNLYINKCQILHSIDNFDSLIKAKIFKYFELY